MYICKTDPRTDARAEIYMQELWFICVVHRLNVLYKCMKFRLNTFNGYQDIKRT